MPMITIPLSMTVASVAPWAIGTVVTVAGIIGLIKVSRDYQLLSKVGELFGKISSYVSLSSDGDDTVSLATADALDNVVEHGFKDVVVTIEIETKSTTTIIQQTLDDSKKKLDASQKQTESVKKQADKLKQERLARKARRNNSKSNPVCIPVKQGNCQVLDSATNISMFSFLVRWFVSQDEVFCNNQTTLGKENNLPNNR